MKTKLGSDLRPEEQREALSRFVHRYTKTHRPKWASGMRPDGTPFPVQFASDSDWLANTEFYVTAGGRLDDRYRHCWSHPTWPDNPELRRPNTQTP